MSDQQQSFGEWAVLELMGHRKLAGFVTETSLAGGAFLRIDIPETERNPAATQFYAPNAIYCITPTSEQNARAVAANNYPAPVQRWEVPALPTPTRLDEEDRDDFDEDREADREDGNDDDVPW